jgi:hypothetical protein
VRHYESDFIIIGSILAMLTKAVCIATSVTVVGGNANVPPTINNVVTDFNLESLFLNEGFGTLDIDLIKL